MGRDTFKETWNRRKGERERGREREGILRDQCNPFLFVPCVLTHYLFSLVQRFVGPKNNYSRPHEYFNESLTWCSLVSSLLRNSDCWIVSDCGSDWCLKQILTMVNVHYFQQVLNKLFKLYVFLLIATIKQKSMLTPWCIRNHFKTRNGFRMAHCRDVHFTDETTNMHANFNRKRRSAEYQPTNISILILKRI